MFTDNALIVCRIRLYICFAVLTFFIIGETVFAGQAETSQIGFSSLTDGYWQIWRMSSDGGNLRQITKSPSDKKEPLWFDKGQKLLYRISNAKLYVTDIKTGEETGFLEQYGNILNPDISADSSRILFTRFRTDITDSSDIWIAPFDPHADENKAKRLTHESGIQYDADISPDGKSVVYVSSSKGKGHGIWLTDVEGKSHVCLKEDGFYNICPDWSPDGKKIAFASNAEGSYDIWLMDSEGKTISG
ncbi:MAG: hypothetical protein BWK80_57310 [Desulfobacteraceae bacterium IS3]|nr:MAG: hypothetical protein BWK80_57310 [Desulfobacteraceae bacterium IS3]